MKTRKLIAELLIFILMLQQFYDGIYKIAYWSNYSNWLHHAPLLKSIWVPLTYIIPIGEIALAIALLISKSKIRVLYILIILQIIYVFWIAFYHAFSHEIYWPFHDLLWKNPLWMQKVSISLGLMWTALICRLLLAPHFAGSVSQVLTKIRMFHFARK